MSQAIVSPCGHVIYIDGDADVAIATVCWTCDTSDTQLNSERVRTRWLSGAMVEQEGWR